ncbi:hypothetical protein DL96DRAFT_1125126 [Flagelloscypha sp. PMI_526]|nr:hypothetical protein DL96DRAFT_1125126 [Flagelloscypha sp. PMI_526]
MFPCLPPSLSLVDKLPVELWSIIFSIYEEERRLELHRKALLPTTSSAYQLAVPPVSHVCIFWRNLILNTPSFWNTVWSRIWRSPSPGTMNLLRTYITRSRHAPRDIRVLVHRQHMAQQSDVLPLLKELFLKPETLRTVQIRLRYGSILNQLFPLCGTTNLEAFDLEVAMPDLEADLHPILKRTPRLKSFSVRGIIPTHASTFQTLIPWSSTHLEHVFLESNWRLARFEYMSDEVDHILSICPTLQRLALAMVLTYHCLYLNYPPFSEISRYLGL